MSNGSRKLLLYLAIAIALVGSIAVVIAQIKSTSKVTIHYKNVKDVAVLKAASEDPMPEEKEEHIVSNSGQTLKLKKNKSYLLNYSGSGDYSGGVIEFNTAEKQKTITIEPYFSEEKLNKQLNSEVAIIHQQIKAKYARINLYEIQAGKLYRYGEWYGTTLKYVGKDPFNSDTLRIVLNKQDGVWTIKTDPPGIFLSRHAFPDVPVEILREVNNRL